jgi:hypothetical protein
MRLRNRKKDIIFIKIINRQPWIGLENAQMQVGYTGAVFHEACASQMVQMIHIFFIHFHIQIHLKESRFIHIRAWI